jgi:hypothetical protein
LPTNCRQWKARLEESNTALFKARPQTTETYSIERLYRLLTRLGVTVSVMLEDQPGWKTGTVEVVEIFSKEGHR